MRLWKTVVKDILKVYLACFGITLIGLILGVVTILIFWEIPTDIFVQLLLDTSLAFLSTPVPYVITLLGTGGGI